MVFPGWESKITFTLSKSKRKIERKDAFEPRSGQSLPKAEANAKQIGGESLGWQGRGAELVLPIVPHMGRCAYLTSALTIHPAPAAPPAAFLLLVVPSLHPYQRQR